MNGQTSRLDIHVWTKCWTLIMVQIVRETRTILQFKSLKLEENLEVMGLL